MSSDHVERLRAMLTPATNGIILTEDGVRDLRAALDELEQARANMLCVPDHQATNAILAAATARAEQAEAERDELSQALTGAHNLNRRLLDRAHAAESEVERIRELLGSIWLYVGWRSATRSLTTEQRELWADAVDANVRRGQIEDGEEPHPVAERWWHEDCPGSCRVCNAEPAAAAQHSAGGVPEPKCASHAHPDFVEDQQIRCELPESHVWHRNGERTWTP